MKTRKLGHLPTTGTKLVAAVAATTIGAAGCLILALPVQAAPMLPLSPTNSPCQSWEFNGAFMIDGIPEAEGDAPWHLSFTSTGTQASGRVVLSMDSGERTTGQFRDGGYGIGGKQIALGIVWDNQPNNYWDLGGHINQVGEASGYESLSDGKKSAHWEARTPLKCVQPLGAPQQNGAGSLPYGPDTCDQGFVWREATPTDHVCVSRDVQQRTAQENSAAARNREPEGGAYGPDTCKQGFVWREAVAGDQVCVLPAIRDDAAADNAASPTHLAAS